MPVAKDTSQEVVEQVAGYEIRIVRAKDGRDSRQRVEERGEAMAAWLLSRWREQHRQEGRN
ncbi:MAG TPA: hypothetical protein PLT35_08970 [Vicinamibacterales bacterium]|nr:hypothetical protein [Vicinamibacterales bacterium]